MYCTLYYTIQSSAVFTSLSLHHHHVIIRLLLLCAVPSPGLGGHGFPNFSIFRCSYHFRFLYLHPFTEALCIDNSLSSAATLSFNCATYAKAFYVFISDYMSKEAHLSASYRNY